MANGYFRIGLDNIKYAGDATYNLNYPLIKPIEENSDIILPKLVILDSGFYNGVVEGAPTEIHIVAPIVLTFADKVNGALMFECSVSTGKYSIILVPTNDGTAIEKIMITYAPANV